MTWPFGNLEMFSYDLIMIDAAWAFKNYSAKGHVKGPAAHYRCMSLDEIRALPVGSLARPNCVLFMWTTWPLIDQSPQILKDWGFRFSSGGVWVKRTVNGKLGFGTGYRLRSACEPWLLGTIGAPKTSHSHRNVFEGLVRGHSRKPDIAYQWAETYLLGAERRADVFSRQSRPGWEACGDEAGKFDEAPCAKKSVTPAASQLPAPTARSIVRSQAKSKAPTTSSAGERVGSRLIPTPT